MNDHEYDQIKTDILSLEKKYDFLSSENSPSKIVGFKSSKNFKDSLRVVGSQKLLKFPTLLENSFSIIGIKLIV